MVDSDSELFPSHAYPKRNFFVGFLIYTRSLLKHFH
jgi:hypothetical protein